MQDPLDAVGGPGGDETAFSLAQCLRRDGRRPLAAHSRERGTARLTRNRPAPSVRNDSVMLKAGSATIRGRVPGLNGKGERPVWGRAPRPIRCGIALSRRLGDAAGSLIDRCRLRRRQFRTRATRWRHRASRAYGSHNATSWDLRASSRRLARIGRCRG
jgi:hypothetical protein